MEIMKPIVTESGDMIRVSYQLCGEGGERERVLVRDGIGE